MEQKTIEFGGTQNDYGFLSNFYMAPLNIYGHDFTNSEAAFQSQKNPANILAYVFADTPSQAKYLGRRENLRPDWDDVKDQVMYEVVYAKFSQNKVLKERLLETGDAELIEVTTWHDMYWGTCRCEKCGDGGKNQLGVTLMQVREKLREEMASV